ncbi:MAG: InlB B-repeat-containing protein [Paludibacteraceae bacterium]|nr:InlB B-repeat-containing protein [Paludibacteraceae bacterium]
MKNHYILTKGERRVNEPCSYRALNGGRTGVEPTVTDTLSPSCAHQQAAPLPNNAACGNNKRLRRSTIALGTSAISRLVTNSTVEGHSRVVRGSLEGRSTIATGTSVASQQAAPLPNNGVSQHQATPSHNNTFLRKVAMLLFVLMLGIGNMWGADVNKNTIIYFDNSVANWDYNYIYFAIAGNDNNSTLYKMTKIDNTKLYVHQRTDNTWTGYNYVHLFAATSDWGSNGGSWSNMTTYGANISLSYNNYGFGSGCYGIKLASAGTKTNPSAITPTYYGSGYSSLNNVTLYLKCKTSTNGGQSFSDSKPPVTLSLKYYTFSSAYNKLSSQGTQNLSTGATSTNKTVGYTCKTTLVAQNATGYTFNGWYAGETKISSELQYDVYPTEGTTYYAYYTKAQSSYTVTYKANGGTGSDIVDNVNAGASHTVRAANTFSRTNWSFLKWSDGDAVAHNPNDKITVNKNLTLYAHWETWMVRGDFDGDGKWEEYQLVNGSATIPITAGGDRSFQIMYGKTDTDSQYYKNTGTMTSSNCTGWTMSTSAASDCKITPTITGNYTFSFNTSNKTLSVTYPTTYTVTVAATPPDYGTVDKTSVTDIPSGATVTKNNNKFTVNGTTVTATATTPATDDGYTYSFKQWNNVPDEVTANVTNAQAVFQRTAKEYTITYQGLEGATHNNPDKYTIESETITFTAPSARTGYTFNGWLPVSIAKGSKGNTEVTASWTENVCVTPSITASQLAAANYTVNYEATALSVTASVTDAGTLSYQWYKNTTASNQNGTILENCTTATYTPSTASEGTLYYYCVVTNSKTNYTSKSTTSSVSGAITVTGDTPGCYSTLAYSGGSSMPEGWTILSPSQNPHPQINNNTIAMAKSNSYTYDSGQPGKGMYFVANKDATISLKAYCDGTSICLVEYKNNQYTIIRTWNGKDQTLDATITNGNTYYLTPKAGSSTNDKCNIKTISFNCSSPVVTTTWYVYGLFKGDESWTNHNLTNGQYSVTLDKNSSYDFKVRKNVSNVTEDVYYGASADDNAYKTSGAQWTLDGKYNVHLKTAAAGSYIFNVITTGDNPQIKVTYPAAYTVTFDMQGHGTAPDPQTNIALGEKAVEPATPADVDGWHFVGWYKEAACTNVWNFNSETISDNTTIYAKWVKKVTSITLSQAQSIYEMQVADKLKLTLAASPDDAEYGTTYTWYSSNASLITVDQDGVVTAKSVGNGAYIYVTNNDGITSNHYTIDVVSGECTGHWSVHMWNNDNWTNRHLCFTQVGSSTTWITQQTVLPSNSSSERIKVLYDNADGYYTKDWATRYVVTNGYRDGECTDVSDGNRYPGQDAIGYFRIYDNSTDENYFLSFEPIYAIRYGSGDNWTITNFNTPETANNYYTDLWQVPNNYTSIQIYAGARTENNVNSIGGRSNTVNMNTITGLTGDNLAGTYGKFKINDNYCNQTNFNLQFIPYYVVELYNNGELFDERQSSLASSPGKVVFSVPEAPTGYDFGGWQRENDTYIVKQSDADWNNYEMWKSYERFNAVWTPQTYTINYKDQGGSDFSGQHADGAPTTYTYGVGATLKSATKTGYEFGGWYFSSNCSGTAVTSIGTDAHENKTLYAKWTEIKVTKIELSKDEFDLKVGTYEDITLTITPATALNKDINYTSSIASNVTITTVDGKYRMTASGADYQKVGKFKNEKSGIVAEYTFSSYYEIVYNTKGGSEIAAQQYYSSSHKTFAKPTDPTKDGYVFAGWFKDEDCEGTAFTSFGSNPNDNITLYAKWAKKYTVTFAAGGGSGSMAAAQVTEGTEYTLPACTFTAPSGKEFDAWTSTDVEIANNKFTMPSKAVTVTATWKNLPEPTDCNAYVMKWKSSKLYDGSTDDSYTYTPASTHSDYLTLSFKQATGISSDNKDAAKEAENASLNTGKFVGNTFTFTPKSGKITKIRYFGKVSGLAEYSLDGSSWTEYGTKSEEAYTIDLNATPASQFSMRNKGATEGNSHAGVWIRNMEITICPSSSPTLSSIAVKTPPTKTSYTAGDNFDPTGLVITKTMSDESTEDVAYKDESSSFSFEPSTSLVAGTTSVTITYGGKTTTQAVTVTAAPQPGECTDTYTYDYSTHNNGGTYTTPDGQTAASGDNKDVSSNPWQMYSGDGISVSLTKGMYDGKGTYMNAYIKMNKSDASSPSSLTIILAEGYTGTLKIKIGGYNGGSRTIKVTGNDDQTSSGSHTPADDFKELTFNLAKGANILTVSGGTAYISYMKIDVSRECECTAPTSPTITGNSGNARTNMTLTASATGTDANTTYTWYKGNTSGTPEQAAATASNNGNKLSLGTIHYSNNDDKYICVISNGDGCTANVEATLSISRIAAPTLTASVTSTNLTLSSGSASTTVSSEGGNGATVAYKVYTNEACTTEVAAATAKVENTTFTATAAGTYYLRAEQAANDDYNAVNSASVAITVTGTTPTPSGDCFSLEMKSDASDQNLAAGGSYDLLKSGKATISGATSVQLINKAAGKAYDVIKNNEIDFSSDNIGLKIELSNALAKGDKISFTTGQSTVRQICFTTTDSRATTIPTTSQSYTIPEGSPLIGSNVLYVWRVSNTTYVKTINIECSATPPTCTPPTAVNITGETNYKAGDNISLTATPVGGEGTPVTYQWYKNGKIISGATATYTIEDCKASDAGVYSCKVSMGDCSKTSFGLQVTVTGDEPCAEPNFTTQPSNVSAKLGKEATFTVDATGAAFYQWYTCDAEGNNCDPLPDANNASYIMPLTMEKVGVAYLRCKAIAACGAEKWSNVASASFSPVEFTVKYTTYTSSSSDISSADAFTVNKEINPAASAYVSNPTNIAFAGTCQPSGKGDGSNWSAQIAIPTATSDADYLSYTFDVAHDYYMAISEIHLPVLMATSDKEIYLTATITDEIGTTLSVSQTITSTESSDFVFDLDDEKLVGTVTVKIAAYGSSSYRLYKELTIAGTINSLPTPTIAWKTAPVNGTVATDNTQIEAIDPNEGDDAQYYTITYRSEHPTIANVVENGGKYYVDYLSAGVANIIATIQGDGLHLNSQPPHSVTKEIDVACAEPTLAWAEQNPLATAAKVGGDDITASVLVNGASTVGEGLTLTAESDNTAIATVSLSGTTITVHPVAAGNVTITVTLTGNGKYYCTDAVSLQKELTIAPAAGTYTIAYTLNDGSQGTNHPTSANTNEAFAVSAPTRTGYTFTGWTVSQGLVNSTALWGTTANPASTIDNVSTLCANGTNDVYFKDLAAAGGSVTLTANWRAECQGGGGGSAVPYLSEDAETGTYLTRTISQDGLTSEWTYNTSSSQGDHAVAEGKTPIIETGVGLPFVGKMNYGGTSNYLTFKNTTGTATTMYIPVPDVASSGTLTMHFMASNTGRHLGLIDNDGEEVEDKYIDYKQGDQSLQFEASELTQYNSKYYVQIRNLSGQDVKKISSFKITLNSTGSGGSGTCYYVRYNVNTPDATGSTMDAAAYSEGASVTTAANGFTHKDSNYEFKGWNTKADGSGSMYEASEANAFAISANTTLYAIWASKTTYTVTYNDGNENDMADPNSPYTANSSVQVLAYEDLEFTLPENKEFDYWKNQDDERLEVGESFTITEDITITAVLKDKQIVGEEHTITYAAGPGATGTAPAPQTVESGTTITMPEKGELAKEGYSFTGWSDGTTTYSAGQNYTMPNNDVKMTAQWELIKVITCTESTSGQYLFEGYTTVGEDPKKTVSTTGTTYEAFSIDNIDFSKMKITFEGGTGGFGGWKINTDKATITFCVAEDAQVAIRLGTCKSDMKITYVKSSSTDGSTTTTTLTKEANNTFSVKGDTKVILTTAGSSTITLKEINVDNPCSMSPDFTANRIGLLKKDVAISATQIATVSLTKGAVSYSYVDNSATIDEDCGLTVSVTSDGKMSVEGTPVNNGTSMRTVYAQATFTNDCSSATEFNVRVPVYISSGKPYVAYVVDGTANGAFNAYSEHSDDALYTKLTANFDVQMVNAYASVDQDKILDYYSQFDVVVITDYPNTKNKSGDISYSNALGWLVDIKPVLTMETFVSNLSNWKAKGLTSDPINPTGDDKTNELTLLCNANDIFGTGSTSQADHFKAGSIHVVTTDLTDPCLQGFAPMEAPDYVFIASIHTPETGQTLITCCERQVNPAARMVVLGMQQKVYPKISDCGYDIVKGLINYLTISDPASIPDCSLIFNGEGGNSNWSNANNWEGMVTPNHISPVRIDAPCVVDVKNAAAGSVKIHQGTANEVTYNGSITVNPGKALSVSKSISRIEGREYSTLLNTEADDIKLLADETNGSGALIIGAEEGTNQATMQLYSKSREENGYYYWQYIGFPSEDINLAKAFPGGYLYQQKETTDGYWTYITSGKAEAFGAYGISLDYKDLYTYTGHLVPTTDKEINLTYSACEGINMIGNSWTAPIQITKMETTDFGEATPTIYIYNTGNDEEAGGGDGVTVEGDETGTWSVIPISATKDDIWKGKKTIPSMQAFEVHTATPTTLTLDYSRIVMPEANTEVLVEPLYAPVRKQAAERHTSMRIVVTGQNKMADLYLFEGENFSETYDRGWDGDFVEGDDNTMQFYSTCALGNMAVNALPDLEGLPIIFKPLAKVNNYTISFNQYGDDTWYFNDIKTQTSTLIDAANTYTFTSEPGDDEARFYISRIPFRTTPTDYETLDEDAENTLKKMIYKEHFFMIINGKMYDGVGKLFNKQK